jgi:hypothetical protein
MQKLLAPRRRLHEIRVIEKRARESRAERGEFRAPGAQFLGRD